MMQLLQLPIQIQIQFMNSMETIGMEIHQNLI